MMYKIGTEVAWVEFGGQWKRGFVVGYNKDDQTVLCMLEVCSSRGLLFCRRVQYPNGNFLR